MITGFGLMIFSMFLSFPMGMNELDESKRKMKANFNDIIELIKEDKLKDAFDKTEKDIHQPTLKTYLEGIIFGTQFKGEGEGLDKLKFKLK
jgi:hypothetical protein